MKSVRIEPVSGGTLVGIVCNCGNNTPVGPSGTSAFNHLVPAGADQVIPLNCPGCEQKFEILPQKSHLHVSEI
jgi:hypothetical protein